MTNFVDNYCEFPIALRRPMWRVWHNLLLRFDKDVNANFMNYGFAELNGKEPIELTKEDEVNRYCIQLYDHVIKEASVQNKKVLEIGSGRGGGAHYISRYYKPLQYTGVDISKNVIEFCNQYYNVPGLTFIEGKAENIPVNSESYDSVINVESARCYRDIPAFFKEVHRVLVNGGKFLFADMIEKNNVPSIRKQLMDCGFNLISEDEITKNVAKSLELDSKRRENLIQKRVPGLWKGLFKNFAGTKGTKRFDSFNNGKFEYWSFILEKNNTEV